MREAGRIRLRPILMTSVAAIFGALPIALGLGAGAGSRRPLGYAIIGGLVVSTLLTLFLVPAVFVVFERLRRNRPGRRRAVAHTPDGGVRSTNPRLFSVRHHDTASEARGQRPEARRIDDQSLVLAVASGLYWCRLESR